MTLTKGLLTVGLGAALGNADGLGRDSLLDFLGRLDEVPATILAR
jgi:hypothetical protein